MNAMLPLAKQGTAAIFISSNGAYMSNPDAETIAIMDDPLAADFIAKLDKKIGNRMDTVLSYCLSKRALIRMCEREAATWGKQGARIMTLSPGMIATPMARLEWKHRPLKYELLKKTPLSREGTLMEIAAATEFLASDAASFISGIDLLVDGGLTAAVRHDPKPPSIDPKQ
jgi:NAD(P)-dependent dehydrogenase (short-subunit alcohol dehydrogenase family)